MRTTDEGVNNRLSGWRYLARTLGVIWGLAWMAVTHAQPQPVVSMQLAPEVVSEADANATITLTFTVDGDIPPPQFDEEGALVAGGLPILFNGRDADAILEETSGEPILEGLMLGDFSDPNNPSVLQFALLQPTSTITLNLLDDVIQEADQSYTFSILPNDACVIDSSYAVNSAASSGAITLSDGQGGAGVGPTVSLAVSQTALMEGDPFTVTFNAAGEMPAVGLQVLVDSPTAGALGEFAIFDAEGNPAVEPSGMAGFPEVGDGRASSFVVTLTEPEASMTLSVFSDGANDFSERL